VYARESGAMNEGFLISGCFCRKLCFSRNWCYITIPWELENKLMKEMEIEPGETGSRA
jgi:hypothetical protein